MGVVVTFEMQDRRSIVRCPTQRTAYLSQAEAISAAIGSDRRFICAHKCVVCGFWHAGAAYLRCPTRKVPHGSRELAQVAADRLNANSDGLGTNYPYHCPECEQWHCGRPHKGRTLQ